MKYGVLFSTLSVLIVLYAYKLGGWFWILLWPAVSFGIVGLAYLFLGHRDFGKRNDGSMQAISVFVLLPYLLYLWSGWHAIRLLSREPAYNLLIDGVWIGRRLLSSELPSGTQTVVDLTSEFPEPAALSGVSNYLAIPMLDASNLPAQSLANAAIRIVDSEEPIYLHCAQGHGRTGLIAALLLITKGIETDPDAALAIVKSARPLVGLNSSQRKALTDATCLLNASD